MTEIVIFLCNILLADIRESAAQLRIPQYSIHYGAEMRVLEILSPSLHNRQEMREAQGISA